jgi:general secretion pathway protein K
VEVEDETGRLSLPRLVAPGLEELGRQIGLKETDLTVFAEALLVWTKATGTSSRYETDPRNYEYADPPHHPPGRPLESFDELASIAGVRELLYHPDGRPNEIHDRFTRSVSRFDFPAMNINTATADTLALAGLDPAQSQRLLDLNSGAVPRVPGHPPFFRSVAEARTEAGIIGPLPGFDTVVHCLRITVTVREGATAFHLIAVVRPGTAGDTTPETGTAPAATTAAAAPAPQSLNYPFTLLDLEEKIELAPPPVS